MWPFKPKTNSNKWRDVLGACDFAVARKEIADALDIAAKNAREKGEELLLHPEFAGALEAFYNNPCAETASRLLDVAPMTAPYFEESKPGGKWKTYHDLLDKEF